MERRQVSFESFLQWAAEHGVSDSPPSSSSSSSSSCSSSCLGHSLSIAHFPEAGGRGLAAVRDLRKGEMILRVPKSLLMTRDSVLDKDPKVAQSLKFHLSLSSTQVLAVCLLAEMNKGRKSFWYPYLMELPRSYDTLTTFGPFETKALQVDDAVWLTERIISKAGLDWRNAIPLMTQLEFKPQFMSFKAWLWASATISSRTLHVPWDDAGCLCPVGDLFNYAAPGGEIATPENCKGCPDGSLLEVGSFQNWVGIENPSPDAEEYDDCLRLTDGGYEEDAQAYCFYAKKNYRKNEQVLLSYGTYTNLELLEHYGFLLDENPNEKVLIPLEVEMFGSHSWTADSLYIHQDGQPSFCLLSALRLWATSPNQRKSVSHLAFSGCQLSPENEKTVMKWIISRCDAILESLPGTVEDDQLLLDALQTAQKLEVLEKQCNLPCVVAMEFDEFMKSMGFHSGGNHGMVPLSTEVKRAMDRWRLAVQWRLSYKNALVNSISFCSRTIETL